jgi:putative endonuclease
MTQASHPENEPDAWHEAPHRHAIGRLGEDAAWAHLQALGYRLLARNWRFGRNEIDIIAEEPSGIIVFVEVKAGRGEGAGSPGERVDGRKRLRVQRVAERYAQKNGLLDREMRFDAITVMHIGGRTSVEHHPHAFLPQLTGYLGF